MGLSRVSILVLLVAVAACSAGGEGRSDRAALPASTSSSGPVASVRFPGPGHGPLPGEQVAALQRELQR